MSASWFQASWRFFIFTFCFSFYSHGDLNKKQVLQDVKILASDEFAGRKPLSEGHTKAQEYIIEQYRLMQLAEYFPGYKQSFGIQKGWSEVKGVNLAARLQGNSFPQYTWVITAHYDHLGKKAGKVYNGANDNASGVAGLLAVAKHFAKTGSKYSLVFLATDAEEMGLLGAKYFVQEQQSQLKSALLNVNLDMIGHGAKRKTLYMMGDLKRLNAKDIVQDIQQRNTISGFRIKAGTPRRNIRSFSRVNWSQASDHAAFADFGIAYLYFGADSNKIYHTPKDDFSMINPTFLFASISAIIDVLEALQKIPPSGFKNNN